MKVKLVISIILAALVLVFGYQNTELVQIAFLAWSIEISLALLVFVALGTGLAIGWLVSSYLRFSRNRRKAKEEANAQINDEVTQTATSLSTTREKRTDE